MIRHNASSLWVHGEAVSDVLPSHVYKVCANILLSLTLTLTPFHCPSLVTPSFPLSIILLPLFLPRFLPLPLPLPLFLPFPLPLPLFLPLLLSISVSEILEDCSIVMPRAPAAVPPPAAAESGSAVPDHSSTNDPEPVAEEETAACGQDKCEHIV